MSKSRSLGVQIALSVAVEIAAGIIVLTLVGASGWSVVAIVLALALTILLLILRKAYVELGLRKFWIAGTKYNRYHLEEARKDYMAMGVTLASFAQVAGVGVDIEGLADKVPSGLSIRLLILHPESEHFKQRVAEAHPSLTPKQAIHKKRKELKQLLKALAPIRDRTEVRFYDAHPTWWVQMIDSQDIYLATQTRESHIGQSYPAGLLLSAASDSWLGRSLRDYLEATWAAAPSLTGSGKVPALAAC